MKRFLATVALLATITTVTAQSFPPPTTTLRDHNGKTIGTATTSTNSEAQIIGTTTEEKDGTITSRDASGQVTGSSKLRDQSQSFPPAR